MNKKTLVGVGIGVALIFLIGIVMGISYNNAEARLRADIEGHLKKIESNFDKMSKVILQQAKITGKYADDFKEIYKNMMTGRYGEDGSKAMWQWIKEQNPQLDASLYKKLMTTVEAQRAEFDFEQKKLANMCAEHKKMFTTFPRKMFVSGEPVVAMIVSSTKAKKAMKTGIDDDVDLFK